MYKSGIFVGIALREFGAFERIDVDKMVFWSVYTEGSCFSIK
jgi:hypothetical protein